MSEMEIVFESVSKHYEMGESVVKALDAVDLTIERGDLLCILGPSGSGKTTFLNLLGGISSVSSGTIRVFGEEISKKTPDSLSTYRRKMVGFVFQFFNLMPTLTALENVELALEMLGKKEEIRKLATEYIKAVGLADRMHHFPSQLSGGQQQRVAIARALAKQPFTNNKFLILCDEPTGNLDETTGNQILNLIKDLNQKYKATFVIVTHNSELPQKLGAKQIHIRDGKIERRQ